MGKLMGHRSAQMSARRAFWLEHREKTDEKTKGQYSICKTSNSELIPAGRQAVNFE